MSDDQFFLDRDSQAKLAAILGQIPGLVEDLAITLTRQSRTGVRVTLHARKDAQPLPYDINASEVTEDLHNTLVSWVRHLCESTEREYDGGTGTGQVARWLAANVHDLAMTEGSEEAYDELRYAFERARQATDISAGRDAEYAALQAKIDPRVTSVRKEELSARDCAELAKVIGVTLTKRRVLYLIEVGAVKIVRMESMGRLKSPVVRFGDVLDAHLDRMEETA